MFAIFLRYRQLQMTQLVHKKDITISAHLADYNGKLFISSMCDIFSEISVEHTIKLNVDLTTLGKQGLTWMLHRLHFCIDEMPGEGETISMTTTPSGIDRLFSLRSYRMNDKTGRELVTAQSEWMVIDIERRRPVRPIQTLIDLYRRVVTPDDLPKANLSIKEIPADMKPVRNYVATFDDIDFNGHVTQASYMRWITNSLKFDFHKEYQMREAEVIYEHEVLPEATVVAWISLRETNNGVEAYHKLTSEDEAITHCVAQTIWRKTL